MSENKRQEDAKSSVQSGSSNKEYAKSQLGGYPEEHDKKWIDKQNSPQGRKRAPGSVRV